MVDRDGVPDGQADDDLVSVPFLVQDLLYLRPGERAPADDVLLASPVGWVTVRGEGPYLAGPAGARVAVVDTDAETGVSRPGARLEPRRGSRRYFETGGTWDADTPAEAFESDAFIQVSAFATVMRTLMLFEGPDGVGRRIPWACGPRLTVVPRAGLQANAFYDRETASLRFFSFPSKDGYLVHAVLSADVVSHETAHAVLDGIVPDLYEAITPQSLAIHEAVADVAAIALTLLNEQVVFSLFAISGGQVDGPEVMSRVADEFGANGRHVPGASYLRSASNSRTLDPADRSVDAAGELNAVDGVDPHALSEVLSGAVFSAFRSHFEELTARPGSDWATGTRTRFATLDEKAVSVAARSTVRLVLRALDHLPPGEISFADLGRAIVAANAAAGGRAKDRDRLASEFVRRGIVRAATELETPVNFRISRLTDQDLDRLLEDDAEARAFADTHRSLLGIPAGHEFDLLPRQLLARTARGGHRQLALRVRWMNAEDHDLGPGFGRRWMVPAGATIVISSAGGGQASTLLRTDGSDALRLDRRAMLQRWFDQGRLAPADPSAGASGRGVMVALDGPDAQRLSGSGRALHML